MTTPSAWVYLSKDGRKNIFMGFCEWAKGFPFGPCLNGLHGYAPQKQSLPPNAGYHLQHGLAERHLLTVRGVGYRFEA
jgi:hypothetical protein